MYEFLLNNWHIIYKSLTFPHEPPLAVIHDFLRNQGVVHHFVLTHGVEAAGLLSAAQLLLQQGALQEPAHFLQGTTQVLLQTNPTLLFTCYRIHVSNLELNLQTSNREESYNLSSKIFVKSLLIMSCISVDIPSSTV